MPPEPDSTTQSVSKNRLRKFLCDVRDSALEQWPILKPWSKRLGEEISGMRQGWILFSVLTLAVSLAVWWVTYSVMKKQIKSSQASKMVIKPDLEQVFEKSYLDEIVMFQYTAFSYEDGSYAYTVKFYERARALATSRNHFDLIPFYAAAKYELNPTSEGQDSFEKILNEMVADLKKHHDPQGFLGLLIASLNQIQGQVPNEEIKFIHHIGDEVAEIKMNAPEQ